MPGLVEQYGGQIQVVSDSDRAGEVVSPKLGPARLDRANPARDSGWGGRWIARRRAADSMSNSKADGRLAALTTRWGDGMAAWDRRFREAHDYAGWHGFATGWPNFHQADYGDGVV